MKRLRAVILAVWIDYGIHYVKIAYFTPTRWRWVPCDRYGRG